MKADYFPFISKVDFVFKETGYQCLISVAGKVKGAYNQPNPYSFDYPLNLNSKSYSHKNNMNDAEALNEALKTLKKQ
jgi:hypothetical protein